MTESQPVHSEVMRANRRRVSTTIVALGAVAWLLVRANVSGSNVSISHIDYGFPLPFAKVYGPGPVIPLRYVLSDGSIVHAFFKPALIFDVAFGAFTIVAATLSVYRWSASFGTGRSAAFCLVAIAMVVATFIEVPQPLAWLLLVAFVLILPAFLIASVISATWWCGIRLVSRRLAPLACVLAAALGTGSAYMAYPHDAYLNPAPVDLPLLLDRRASSDVRVRLLAIRALGRLDLKDEQIADAIIDSLDDDHALVRGEAMSLVSRLGPASVKAVPALVAAMQGPHGDFLAARALGEMGEFAKSATPALRSELPSAKGYDQLAIAEALWSIERDTELVVPALIDLLDDEFGPIRRDAASALGRIGPAAKAAVPKLIEMLRRSPPADVVISHDSESSPEPQIGNDVPTTRLMTDYEFYPQLRNAATEALRKVDPESAHAP